VRVVLDTNVYISAILFGGNCEEILRLAGAGSFELVISKSIILELRGILEKKFRWHKKQVSETISHIKNVSTEVKPGIKVKIILNDPSDNKILECAVASRTQYIVTGNKHLLDVKTYNEISILTPADFLKL
jgi:putative PIN family toxin of toxin-antitoxin system